MRADARASREALIASARRLIAERGLGVPFSTVADDAGVGIGTLYRHFPTREDLFVGLVGWMMDQTLAVCAAGERAWDDDPERAWVDVVRGLAALRPGALMGSLGEWPDAPPAEALRLRARGLEAVAALTQRAVAAGLVGPDLTAEKLTLGIGVLTRPLPAIAETQVPGLHDWLVETYLRGLRAGAV